MGEIVFAAMLLGLYALWAGGTYLLYKKWIKRTTTWTVDEDERVFVKFATIGAAMAVMYVAITVLIVILGSAIAAALATVT